MCVPVRPGDRAGPIASTSASTATTGSRSSRLDGKPLGVWGESGRGPGQLNNPWALAVDRQGDGLGRSTRTTTASSGSGSDASREPTDGMGTMAMLGNLLGLTVGRPWWLILLPLILPPLVLFSYRSLAGLGTVRRVAGDPAPRRRWSR